MWICRRCSKRVDDAAGICPGCGAACPVPSTVGEAPVAGTMAALDPPTEYDLQGMTDPGASVVECYIGVTESEASDVASRLRDLGIPVFVGRDESGEAPVHRVRVPIADLGRSLAVIDLLHRRRVLRH